MKRQSVNKRRNEKKNSKDEEEAEKKKTEDRKYKENENTLAKERMSKKMEKRKSVEDRNWNRIHATFQFINFWHSKKLRRERKRNTFSFRSVDGITRYGSR